MKSFCGFSNRTRGKSPGTVDTCIKQWRLYGKYMIEEDRLEQNKKDIVGTLMNHFTHDQNRTCGFKSLRETDTEVVNANKMVGCQRQYRLFGLFPVINKADDLRFETLFSPHSETTASWVDMETPVEFLQHSYSRQVFLKQHPNPGKTNVLFLIAYSDKMTDSQLENAKDNWFTARGIAGYAFGYFETNRRGQFIGFQIVRVFVHSIYRGTDFIPSKIIEELKDRAKSMLITGLTNARIGVDTDAPCFKLFTRDFESAGPPWVRSNRIKTMYEKAGFTAVPVLGNNASSIARFMECRVDT
jgi:GNAT superfamily N-acetyltransferase